MTPCASSQYVRYARRRDAMFAGEGNPRGPRQVRRADRGYLLTRQTCQVVGFPPWAFPAPLDPHVPHVVIMRTQEQVLRIAAARVVASVADEEREGVHINAHSERLGESVGQYSARAVAALVDGKPAIPLGADESGPRPALPRSTPIDLLRKVLRQGEHGSLTHPERAAPGVAPCAMALPTLWGDAVTTVGLPVEKLKRGGLLLPALAAPLRSLYGRIVHWVTSSGPVPGDDSRAGTFAFHCTTEWMREVAP